MMHLYYHEVKSDNDLIEFFNICWKIDQGLKVKWEQVSDERKLELAKRRINPNSLFYLIKNTDNQTIGALWLEEKTQLLDNDNRALWLKYIELLPEFQGKGFSKTAMTFIEEIAKERELEKVELVTSKDKSKVITLFKNMNYNKIDLLPSDLAETSSKIYFQKDLE